MNTINSAQLLSQIRDLNSQIEVQPPKAASGVDFASLLNNSLEGVNSLQQTGAAQAAAFEAGDPNTDLTSVMISLQKASLSFEAMTEVRNKLVNAYQEIMNMPV